MTVHLDPSAIPAHLRGSYTGRKFTAEACETVNVPATAGLWDGGTRDLYQALELSTGKAVDLIDRNASPWSEARGMWPATVSLKPGYCIRRETQGWWQSVHFYVHPADIVSMLPAPAPELDAYETAVLTATATFKASYGGQDRRQMWNANGGVPTDITPGEWATAKLHLIELGLLNAAGAITTKGRNAAKGLW